MTSRGFWTRYRVSAFSLLSGALLFWLALRSEGADWYISQTHADVMFSGLRKFREFPFFSFVFDGGTYFLQDPQSNLFSPIVPLTLLVGPSVALRLLNGIWGCLGVWLFTRWMQRRVSLNAALLGGIANVTSLGVLWRVAVGNDMFVWHLGLPALLWAAELVICERTLRGMALLGLASALLLLGPTFGSFMHLFLPVVPLVMLAEWLQQRPNPRQLAHSLLLLLGACVIAALIASPKLVCWLTFSMKRPVDDWGPIPLGSALRHLVDFTISKQQVVLINVKEQVVAAGSPLRPGWGEEETAVALQPAAAVLALIGCISLAWQKPLRRTGLLAFALIGLGLYLSCSWSAFEAFRAWSDGGFRVVQRFLAISGFGLAMLVALGAEALLPKLRSFASVFTACAGCSMLASVVWWTWSASHFTGNTWDDAVHATAIAPFARFEQERQWVDGFSSYDTLRRSPGLGRDFLKGGGFTDGFVIVGNDFDPRRWSLKNPLPIVAQGGSNTDTVTVEHTRVTIRHLKAEGSVALRIHEPQFGLTVTTVPPHAPIEVFERGKFLIVKNQSDLEIERVSLRAKWPISRLWFLASAFGFLGAGLLVVLGSHRCQRLASAAPPK